MKVGTSVSLMVLTSSDLSSWVTAAGAGLLLAVERSTAASLAESMGLGVSFTFTGGTLWSLC
jgi:hypothetical protein